jgi:2-methylisocitrate lyase-like PEP mutase family enzyme
MTAARQLRDRLGAPPIMIVPGAADAITARVIAEAGFPAVYVTGAGFANASFGVPDVGLVSVSEVVAHVQRIADAVEIPVIADADTGYGGVLNVYRTVRNLERAGAAAIQLEDQAEPKRCGHFDDQALVTTRQMLDRLAAALDARVDGDLVIIARTDARGSEGFAGAIERAHAYADAGADMIFMEALPTMAELAEAPRLLKVPTIANMVEGGKTPLVPANELGEFGYKIALFANTAMRLAVSSVQRGMATLLRDGMTHSLVSHMLTWEERQRLVGLSETQERERRYLAQGDA